MDTTLNATSSATDSGETVSYQDVYQQIAEMRERLARLEAKVDMLLNTLKNGKNGSKIMQWLFAAWLSFLSAVIGWLALR